MGSYTPPKKRPAPSKPKTPGFRQLALAIALPAIALGGYFAYRSIAAERAFVFTRSAPSQQASAAAPALPEPRKAAPANTEAKPEPEPAPAAAVTPKAKAPALKRATHPVRDKRIAIIIDDIGFENQPLGRVAAIDPNLSFSVIPNTPRATQSADYLAERGFEILCHLPMEPIDGRTSPGKGAVLVAMSDDQVREQTVANFRAVPHARGVNNHMGSRATADRRVMEQVLAALRSESAYFVDSRTTPRSVAYEMARATGVPAAARSVFLDDDARDAAVLRQLERLADAAERDGVAVGIGHAYASTIRVLEREIPRLRERGFRFVRVSEVVE